MTEPLSFPSTTPRYALPLLFVGQAQKEATVNQAQSILDRLLHPTIEGELSAPPGNPSEGDTWLVGPGAAGAFEGHSGALAWWSAGSWNFAAPHDGLRVFDRATGQFLLFSGEWRRETGPSEPVGGTVIDAEGRAAIVAILHLLRKTGILPDQ